MTLHARKIRLIMELRHSGVTDTTVLRAIEHGQARLAAAREKKRRSPTFVALAVAGVVGGAILGLTVRGTLLSRYDLETNYYAIHIHDEREIGDQTGATSKLGSNVNRVFIERSIS